ncbi:MAG: kinase/pyrophosphorylase, partial [Pseudomonadota bacterium]
AMQFSLNHDDGLSINNIEKSDVVIIGVSRTSKSPTCLYLGNMGIYASNIPFIANIDMPKALFDLNNKKTQPLIVGLVKSPEQLAGIRKQRMVMVTGEGIGEYSDIDHIKSELRSFRRLCKKYDWPIIDVSHRSIEETSAEIIRLLEEKKICPQN